MDDPTSGARKKIAEGRVEEPSCGKIMYDLAKAVSDVRSLGDAHAGSSTVRSDVAVESYEMWIRSVWRIDDDETEQHFI